VGVILLVITLSILNLNEEYKDPPVSNLGKLFNSLFQTTQEFSWANLMLFAIGVSFLVTIKKIYPKVPSIGIFLMLVLFIRM
jgi:hypothetical protein